MNKLKAWPVTVLVASLVLAMGLVGGASASKVIHRATAGSPDLCDALGLKPGCDANFSLAALKRADGSVSGEWHDQFTPIPEFGGLGIHVAVDCLNIVGNQAWVSGVITQSRFAPLVGLGAIAMVVDNGGSANDAADQISFSFIDLGVDCNAAPALPLFSVPQGQVVVA